MLHLEEVKQLIGEANDPILTLYVNTDSALQENQADSPAWRIWLKNTLKQLEGDVKPAQRKLWTQLRGQAESYFDRHIPQAKGLALFISPDMEVDYPLNVPVENAIAFGKPLVTPLLWAIDEYEPYLIVMVDHEIARFLVSYLGSIAYEETITPQPDKTAQTPSGSTDKQAQRSARDDFEKRVDRLTERFYQDVARRMVRLAAEHKARRMIIGGAEQSAKAVRDSLPPTASSSVVAVMSIPMRYSSSEVLEYITPAALDYERREEVALVRQVVNMAKAGGRAALGNKAVLAALDQHRVELLVAPWPPADQDKIAELALRVFAADGQIELVHGEAADQLNREGGLAAQLYYAL